MSLGVAHNEEEKLTLLTLPKFLILAQRKQKKKNAAVNQLDSIFGQVTEKTAISN